MPFFLRGLWKNSSKHKKLCEEWALANSRECVESGNGGADDKDDREGGDDASEVSFVLKYLGSTLVETPSSEEATAEAIRTVITMAKASGKKLQRVTLSVSLKGIRMSDLATEEDQLQVSIYRISYCSADATHDHVFAFIATNLNETMECHAFLCPKRKTAQNVTLTVARAFNTAYEAWQSTQSDPRLHPSKGQEKNGGLFQDQRVSNGFQDKARKDEKDADRNTVENKRNNHGNNKDSESQKMLIDLSNDGKSTAGNSWVCFEDEQQCVTENGYKKLLGNSIPMTNLRHTATSSPTHLHHNRNPSQNYSHNLNHNLHHHHNHHHHIVPRPTTSLKMQNAWGESRSVDVMCS